MRLSSSHPAPGITVELSGGLGNQLFQYATARSLAINKGVDLTLDISFYDVRRHRSFDLGQLPVHCGIGTTADTPRWLQKARRLGRKMLRIDPPEYREPHFHFDPHLFDVSTPIRLRGYFQSPKYFEEHAQTIRAELQPPAPKDEESQKLSQLIEGTEAVSLHVRRGDYVTNAKARQTFHQCSVEYYSRAMKHFDGPFVVISDDIQWAMQNLPRTQDLVFTGQQQPRSTLADLWLMTQTKHHIIANSTFSWWGAWLSSHRDGRTVAPRNWFLTSEYSTKDLLPAKWLQE